MLKPILNLLAGLSLFLLMAPVVEAHSVVAAAATPGEVVTGKAGKSLDKYLSDCEAFGFSGAVLVQHKGRVVLSKGYGKMRPGDETPNTPETLFDLASASKQVTAAAILLLETQGKLTLEDSIADHLPGVPEQHREVTLFHLLTHTSGFPRDGSAGHGDDLEAAMEGYFSQRRTRKAGAAFDYYNGGYAMLAGVVEQVTGEAFEDWVRANLFQPAGMERTDFIETVRVDEELLSSSLDSGKLTTDYIKGWGYRGMGGVLTSVSDLALWCNALFGGEVLPEDALDKMLTPYKEGYGLGWYVLDTERGRKVIQHGGTSTSFESYIRYFPKEEALILVMTNRAGWGWQSAYGASSVLLDSKPETYSLPEVNKAKAKDIEPYCGIWRSGSETLFIKCVGRGIEVGAIGTRVVAGLTKGSGRPTTAPARAKSGDTSELQEAEAQALAILEELRVGKVDLLASLLLPHIPKSWPGRVATTYWPEFIARWGKVQELHVLGSFMDPATKRTRVWIQAKAEHGSPSIEIAFQGDKFNILDLKAMALPATAHLAPTKGKRMVGYDFTASSPYELEIKGKRASRVLVLKLRGQPDIEFSLDR